MNHDSSGEAGRDPAPRANRALLALAGTLLIIPIVALLWVDSYARVEPTLAGFPFFIWYQFLWVFLCSAMTWAAYRVIDLARRGRGAREEARR